MTAPHGRAKVDEGKMRYIRENCKPGSHYGPHLMGESIAGKARQFGISRRQIRRILDGENWRELDAKEGGKR